MDHFEMSTGVVPVFRKIMYSSLALGDPISTESITIGGVAA
jgi:hypothetical protein